MSRTRFVPVDRLKEKTEIRRLVTEAQKSLGRSTDEAVAVAIGMKGPALSQAIRRGSLAEGHRRALEEVIATGRPILVAFRSEELESLKAELGRVYVSLGTRGRAELVTRFFDWIGEQLRKLSRLDSRGIRAVNEHGGKH